MSAQKLPEQTPGDIALQREIEQATEALRATAPELLEGYLPKELQERFLGVMGPDKDYAVGVNQSRGMEDKNSAEELLAGRGGISMNGDDTSFGRRFVIFDADSAEQGSDQWLAGYYGPATWGRLVTVFPVDKSDDYPPSAQVNELEDEALPQDFLTIYRNANGAADLSVSAKYVAGFIDDQGFHPNASFLTEERPSFNAPKSSQDLPKPRTTPMQARQSAMDRHADAISDMTKEASRQGIYPSELGAHVLSIFDGFEGDNFDNTTPSGIQGALIERSGPGQSSRPAEEALAAARDGSGAKKMIRDGINEARKARTAADGVTKPVTSGAGTPPRQKPDTTQLDLTYLS